MASTYRFFAACPPYTEELVIKEAQALGAQNSKPAFSGAWFEGTLETAYRFCLHSRVASRLALILSSFPCPGKEALLQGASAVSWTEHFPVTESFRVRSTVARAQWTNPNFASLLVKDAVCDAFRKVDGKRPDVDPHNAVHNLFVFVHGENAHLGYELNGESLHRRGYRIDRAEASMRENTAAAMLLRAGWDTLAQDASAFVDPVCGAGTLVIEAALIAANIAPGSLRQGFGFERWLFHDGDLWNRLKQEALEQQRPGRIPPLFGFDIDHLALQTSNANAKRAGVSDLVKFSLMDALNASRHYPVPRYGVGMVAANPPYGDRLNPGEDLQPFYKKMADRWLNEFPAWQAALITEHEDLSFATGLRADKTYHLKNGEKDCVVSLFTLKAEKRLKRDAVMDDDISNRLKKRLAGTGKWADENGVDCYRLYDRDLPQYAFAVDLYRCQDKSLHLMMQEFSPPKTIDEASAEQRRKRFAEALHALLPQATVHERLRRPQKGDAQYAKYREQGQKHVVGETGLKFIVDFDTYLDSGLFLDHRKTRNLVQGMANGKNVLNLFCYTGSFSVYAAAGGASRIVSVDTSRRYLTWSQENFSLNRFSRRQDDFVMEDVFEFLKTNGEFFDLVIVDPPSFSNSKSRAGSFDVERDHEHLLELCLRRLSPDGKVLFSCNRRRFKLSEAISQRHRVEDLTGESLDEDFDRKPPIHQCFLIRK